MNTIVLFILFINYCQALDNGVALTPPMGYNTWYDMGCNYTSKDVIAVADSMIKLGLDKLGYIYVNLDDCWQLKRDSNGVIIPDPVAFPDGIKPVADYLHSRGLKFGLYTDRGTNTCGGRPGSLGFEYIDAMTYASWGVDFVKEDSCYASQNHDQAFLQYGAMRDSLNATGRDILFSLCGWYSWYAPVGTRLGNMWRISGDCDTWNDVITAIDVNSGLSQYAGPGGWNDPDIMLGSSPATRIKLPPNQSRTMFSMWCVMAAPLIIGSHIAGLDSWDIETYTNTELIAVNQDKLGVQGVRLSGGNLSGGAPTNVWGKKLSDGNWALCFLNNAATSQNIVCDNHCLLAMGASSNSSYTVRELWTKQVTRVTGPFTAASVPALGSSVSYKFIFN